MRHSIIIIIYMLHALHKLNLLVITMTWKYYHSFLKLKQNFYDKMWAHALWSAYFMYIYIFHMLLSEPLVKSVK